MNTPPSVVTPKEKATVRVERFASYVGAGLARYDGSRDQSVSLEMYVDEVCGEPYDMDADSEAGAKIIATVRDAVVEALDHQPPECDEPTAVTLFSDIKIEGTVRTIVDDVVRRILLGNIAHLHMYGVQAADYLQRAGEEERLSLTAIHRMASAGLEVSHNQEGDDALHKRKAAWEDFTASEQL